MKLQSALATLVVFSADSTAQDNGSCDIWLTLFGNFTGVSPDGPSKRMRKVNAVVQNNDDVTTSGVCKLFKFSDTAIDCSSSGVVDAGCSAAQLGIGATGSNCPEGVTAYTGSDQHCTGYSQFIPIHPNDTTPQLFWAPTDQRWSSYTIGRVGGPPSFVCSLKIDGGNMGLNLDGQSCLSGNSRSLRTIYQDENDNTCNQLIPPPPMECAVRYCGPPEFPNGTPASCFTIVEKTGGCTRGITLYTGDVEGCSGYASYISPDQLAEKNSIPAPAGQAWNSYRMGNWVDD